MRAALANVIKIAESDSDQGSRTQACREGMSRMDQTIDAIKQIRLNTNIADQETSEVETLRNQLEKFSMEIKQKNATIKCLEKAFEHLSIKRVTFKNNSENPDFKNTDSESDVIKILMNGK